MSEHLPVSERRAIIRFEIHNSEPVDLPDLTSALLAFGNAFQDYCNRASPSREKLRLSVEGTRGGSIDLDFVISSATQIAAVVEHIDLAVKFVQNLRDIYHWFIPSVGPGPSAPSTPLTTKELDQVRQIFKPIANHVGSQLNIAVAVPGGVHFAGPVYFNVSTSDAARWLADTGAPRLPSGPPPIPWPLNQPLRSGKMKFLLCHRYKATRSALRAIVGSSKQYHGPLLS
jgi:hypothetical protein